MVMTDTSVSLLMMNTVIKHCKQRHFNWIIGIFLHKMKVSTCFWPDVPSATVIAPVYYWLKK